MHYSEGPGGDKKKGIIYKVTSPSGHIYIGQTIAGIKRRKQTHESCSRNLNHSSYNTRFSAAIRKYGDAMIWEVIHENVDIEKLDEMEIREIENHNSYHKGYNSTLGGGDAGFRGKNHTEETKKFLSQIRSGDKNPMHGKTGDLNPFYGRKHSDETRAVMSERHVDVSGEKNPMFGKPSAMKGKNHTKDSKIKMSKKSTGNKNPFYGRKHTEETKLKMREAAQKRKSIPKGKNE